MRKFVSVTLVVCMMLSLCVVPMASGVQTFWDVPESHWAYSHVMNMVERGVVSGYPDGGFHPDAYVTRAEAATMIAKIAGMKSSGYSRDFADVYGYDWYAPYIEGVKRYFNSYNEADGTTTFHPNDYATREDVIVALMKRNARQELHEVKSPETAMKYTDFANVRKENQPYFEEAINQGIVTGYADGTVRPNGNLTRAEMVTLLSKIYDVPWTYEELLATGEVSYNFGCTLEEFIERYNNAVSANYDILLQETSSPTKEVDLLIEKATKPSDMYEGWYNFINFSKAVEAFDFGSVNNCQGYFLGNDSYGGLLFFVICKNNRVVWISREGWKMENEFKTACMIIASMGTSYEEACDIIKMEEENPYFTRVGNACLDVSDSSFTLVDVNEIQKVKFGLAVAKQGEELGALDITIDKLIEKYNANIKQSFKYTTVDTNQKWAEDYMINPNGLVREDIHKYDGEMVEINQYFAGTFVAYTDKQNRVIEVIPNTEYTIGSIHVNDDPKVVDISNAVHISMIMALEDISFSEAKVYYEKMQSGRITKSDKMNYDSEGFKSILEPKAQTVVTIVPEEETYTLRKLTEQALTELSDTAIYNNEIYYVDNLNEAPTFDVRYDSDKVYVSKMDVKSGETEEFFDPSDMEYEAEYDGEDIYFYGFVPCQIYYDKENNRILMNGVYTEIEDDEGEDERYAYRDHTFVYDITKGNEELLCVYPDESCDIAWVKEDNIILSNGCWVNTETEEVTEGYAGEYLMEYNGTTYRMDYNCVQRKYDGRDIFYDLVNIIAFNGDSYDDNYIAIGDGCYYIYDAEGSIHGSIYKYYVEEEAGIELIKNSPVKELQNVDETFFAISDDYFVFYDHDTQAFYALEAN